MPIILDPVPVPVASDLLLPGIEARHTWVSGRGVEFSFAGVDPGSRAEWPNYRLQKIDGRHAKADSEDKRDQATGRIGEIVRRSLKRGKTEAWTGLVRGRTAPELRRGVAVLQAAFAEEDEGTMTIFAPASYPGLPDFTFTARVVSCSAPDEQTFGPDRLETGGWERSFTLGLRLSDPRYYSTVEQTVQTTGFVSDGGVWLPVSVPFDVPGPAAPMGGMVASNGGTAPAEPVFEIHGPVPDPWLVNDTIDASLYFKLGSLTVGQGQVLTVDFRDRTLALDGQPVSRDRIDWSLSNWWDAGVPGLVPGDNQIRFGGFPVADPAFVVARWHDAVYA